MRSWRSAFVLGLAVALVSVPALASHVTEPQRPISDFVLEGIVFDYPQRATALPCDGSTTDLNAVRVEVDFKVPLSQDTGDPSEHWLRRWTHHATGHGALGDDQLAHQNTPPHLRRGVFNAAKFNRYDLQLFPGLHTIEVEFIGQETGEQLEYECTFKVEGDGGGTSPPRTR